MVKQITTAVNGNLIELQNALADGWTISGQCLTLGGYVLYTLVKPTA